MTVSSSHRHPSNSASSCATHGRILTLSAIKRFSPNVIENDNMVGGHGKVSLLLKGEICYGNMKTSRYFLHSYALLIERRWVIFSLLFQYFTRSSSARRASSQIALNSDRLSTSYDQQSPATPDMLVLSLPLCR